MDSVWFVRPGPNEELKFSLRSAYYHVGVENVWIVGDPPHWYTGPRIVGNRHRTKQRNVFDNVRILAEHPGLPDEVAVWNDDFFAMMPGSKIEMAWRSTLAEHIDPLRPSWWKQSLEHTYDYLLEQGCYHPLSYELHRPFPVHRETMATILADAARYSPMNPPQWRTLYGNLANAGGFQDSDGKLNSRHGDVAESPWISTDERTFARVASRVRVLFSRKSPWER